VKKNLKYQLLFTAILSCFFLGFSCGKSVEPVEAPKDYIGYFWSAVSNDANWYFAYHPTTNVVDSIFLPYASFPVVSADGKKLYIRDDATSSAAVLETDSFTVIEHLSYNSVRGVSPDNKLILAFKTGQGSFVVKTADYSPIYQDSTLWYGRFSSNSKRIYTNSGDNVIHRIELSDSVFESAQFIVPFGEVRGFEPSRDESKIFYYLQTGIFSHHFAVYDIASDSVLFTELLTPGFGVLATTPDGRFVFYSNSGTMLGPTPGTPFITVYSVESNNVLTRITTAGLLEEPYQNGIPLGQLCVTPDGKWLIAMPARSFDFIFTIDVRTMAIDKFVGFRQGFLLGGLTCQNAP